MVELVSFILWVLGYIAVAYRTQSHTLFFKPATPDQALAFDHSADAGVRDVADAYMFGPSLLVTPIVSAGDTGTATTREVNFPQGAWVDFHTGQDRLRVRRNGRWEY